uniref:Uncharacterized protein n=1 Tax=Angiostrongylus cantonensis TaxID=6313 RepID=A0A0K0DHK8_ANGCA
MFQIKTNIVRTLTEFRKAPTRTTATTTTMWSWRPAIGRHYDETPNARPHFNLKELRSAVY